jgi:uncharacterized membrane protein YbhN (UPF0104 family)
VSRRPAARLVSAVLVLVLVAAFAWALSGRWGEVVSHLREQQPLALLGSLALALVAVGMSFLLWRGVLDLLGSPVPVRTAARIFFVAQLGKYLPGSLWPVVAQMRMGKEAGIPRQRIALAFALTLGLSVVWGLLIGLLGLPALVTGGEGHLAWALLVVPLGVLLLLPRPLNWVLDRGLRLLRRPGLEQPLPGRAVVVGSAWTVAFWVVFGLHVWLLAVGVGADPLVALPVAIGGFALAFSVGPLLVVLPAGAGVREAALVVLLSPVLGVAPATAVALTSRGVLMVTDGLLAVGAGVLAPRRRTPVP